MGKEAYLTLLQGIAELWDDFAHFVTIFQWFQPPIHPALCNAIEKTLNHLEIISQGHS
ncbi:MAG: hypothetical protein HWQ43_02000 [Nostoc sp. JL31]|uniref:hypothetical protein n=1 Tax=Nostoc sp. JL31 TaxID=2815395 RepID=UPI0025D2B69D|nr:hypothetical protein [Nostoc sp. JL31]MBN3887990.1 hypothetical protein [Nostoc sp. JL31]